MPNCMPDRFEIGAKVELEKDGVYYLCSVSDLDALNGR